MLEVYNLDFDYPDKTVLRTIQFSVPAGSLLHLRGENGSGKSTLLKLLAGLLYPDQGQILYHEKDIHADRATYQQHICYVGHKPGISLGLTVAENCRFDLYYPSSTNKSIEALIANFGLQGMENKLCGLLSAGQRRRVGLIKLLFSRKALWLLDEPFVSLDQSAIFLLTDCLIQHLNQGGAIIMTSHQAIPLSGIPHQEYTLQ
ncbi:cytochrome c biogenesis ATP-binding export protein CcmA [Legionella impletisoli]|uniref:Cytochrome c biogenesis ATP-binding export protein CcmA n=2 Tax=Legionella impletisoli TaxID=343510 RepID=A0A917N8T7_9GAMM|nr:cytochrome c biogenesis heme-transporting ATPase CcmA [Legionella impletisoli]GGI78801.1 cytochrome c biogenesis ATP-binding export protein CcmA [Legionella impletisoli]